MRSPGAVILGAITMVACVNASPEAVQTLPTPFPEIATTPELETWATSRILSFREAQGSEPFIGFGLRVLAPSAALESAESRESVLMVSSAEPPSGWFATPLGEEPVVIVVNADNLLRDLSPDEISNIFAGQTDNWQALGGPNLVIQPVIPLEGAETRSYLQDRLLGDQRFTTSALLGPTPEAVLEMVQENIGAIGILPLSALSAEVGVVSIDGQNPMGRPGYPWLLEILGMAPVEPTGIVREWLAWLQAAET